ncbi:MAG TPA: ribosome small subunit-dependent GTPase A [Polyangiaceae bacterium]|jgi:ribosome biogenesis GTPase|nr:ribosome small subunit-dependent GTPase A [Polyangiaceae bacterium]
MTLADVGLSDRVLAQVASSAKRDAKLARITRVDRGAVVVHDDDGERVVSVAKSMAQRTPPAIGDWALVDVGRGALAELLPRWSALVRRAAGRREVSQVVAANIDLVLVLIGLDGDFNLRRLDRYLALVGDSGARPYVLLTKAGLVADADAKVAEVRAHCPGIDVAAVDVVLGVNADLPRALVPPGTTAALVGSSGVGKSTLVNHLLGATVAATRAVRDRDDRGVHTTSRRELFRVEGGGVVIDTPGMRELGMSRETSLDEAFPEIVHEALSCKFTDCRHATEAGCAVKRAIAEGRIEARRLASFEALRLEQTERSSSARDAIRRKR